jgi:hypothetical protein
LARGAGAAQGAFGNSLVAAMPDAGENSVENGEETRNE